MILAEDFYQNESEAKQALNGVYRNINNRYVTGDAIRHVVTDLTRYATWDDGAGLSDYSFGADNTVLGNVWSGYYSVIKDCNVAISSITNNSEQIDNYERYVAQARGVRAYLYFNLVRWWGDVPLVTEPVTSLTENLEIARTPQAEVFEQIIEDFNYCVEYSMSKGETDNGYQWGLMTKGAAKGFLSKVYLWLGSVAQRDGVEVLGSAEYNFEQSMLAAKDVINGAYGSYSLVDYYPDVFSSRTRTETEEELMWAALSMTGDDTGSYTGMMFGIVGTQMVGGSWGNISSSDYHRTLYQTADDVRRLWNCPRVQVNATGKIWGWDYNENLTGGNEELTASKGENNWVTWGVGKYRRIPLESPQTYIYSNFSMNEPILRYADILLTYAEACNEYYGKPDETAFEAVNEVRKRAANYIDGENIHHDTTPRGTLSVRDDMEMWGNGEYGNVATSYTTNTNGDVENIAFQSDGNYTNGSIVIEEANIYTHRGYGSDYDAFRSEILNERAREFVGEGSNDRWCDLVRRGILVTQMKTWLTTANPFIGGSRERNINYDLMTNVSTTHYLLPIPQSELDSNRALTQNPGY